MNPPPPPGDRPVGRTGASRRTVGRSRGRATAADARIDRTFATGTGTQGLTNARTRLVGDRTGPVADAVVLGARVLRVARRTVRAAFGAASGIVTPLGWVVLATAPVALLLGHLLGWVELVVVGVVAVVLLVVAAVFLLGRSSFTVALSVPHPRVTVGEAAVGQVTVSNPTRRRVLGATVEVPVGTGLAELVLPGLRPGQEDVQDFTVPTARRGLVRVGPVRTVRGDPVGVARRELEWTDVVEVHVHPRTIGIPSTSTGLVRDLEGTPTRDLSTSDISFHAIREYQPGDERRNIHWRSTAKTGTYMVRQFEETRRSHLVVALSLSTADHADEEEFELAVSVAGSLGVRAVRDARDLSVVVSGRTPEFAKRKTLEIRHLATLTRARLLDDLAVVEESESALGIADVARVAADTVGGISVAFLVVGSGTPLAELRAASAAMPLGVETVAVVCDPEAVPGMRRLGELTVLTIGYLEDLQMSLARAAAT